MARPLRIIHPAGWYHITARGKNQRPIFADDEDRRHFLELLRELVLRFRLRLHAYVLMENHYHLLVELSRPNLSRSIQWLNVSYSAWFNRRCQRSGHLFQGRFKSVVAEPRAWGVSLSAYIHLNPVRVAKDGRKKNRHSGAPAPTPALVSNRLAQLRRYPWSSYAAYIGVRPQPAWLACQEILTLGGAAHGREKENYRAYVERQICEGLPEKPWDSLTDQILLGGAKFIKEARAHARGPVAARPRPPRWSKADWKLPDVIAAVEKTRGEPWADFKNRHADTGRDQVLYFARRTTSLSLADLAKAMGMKNDATVSMAIKRYAETLTKYRQERAQAEQTAKTLNVEI